MNRGDQAPQRPAQKPKQRSIQRSIQSPAQRRSSSQRPGQSGSTTRSALDEDERRGELTLREVWERGLKLSYEQQKAWRIQRKIDARHRPLEFCLRPYLALLLYTLALGLVGRGLTHFSGETPYTSIWWSEELFWPIAKLVGGWESYSTSARVEATLNVAREGLGALFALLGVWALFAPRLLSQSLKRTRAEVINDKAKMSASRATSKSQELDGAQRLSDPPRGARLGFKLCWLIALLQTHYVFALWWEHGLRWATLMEQALHVVLPISCALMLPYTQPRFEPYAERLLKVGVSLCFIGHGLYALDIAPLPASFLTMTLNLTPFGEEGARLFLMTVGALDIIAALCVWLPISELRRSALAYMIIWGGLTALARPLGEPSLSLADRALVWGPELLWRLPHMLAPLWLWRRAQLYYSVGRSAGHLSTI